MVELLADEKDAPWVGALVDPWDASKAGSKVESLVDVLAASKAGSMVDARAARRDEEKDMTTDHVWWVPQ